MKYFFKYCCEDFGICIGIRDLEFIIPIMVVFNSTSCASHTSLFYVTLDLTEPSKCMQYTIETDCRCY